MALTDDQLFGVFGKNSRNGLLDEKYRWTNGIVPYVVSDAFNVEQVKQIRSALNAIESISCIQFVDRTDEVDYVEVIVSVVFYLFFFGCVYESVYDCFTFFFLYKLGTNKWL